MTFFIITGIFLPFLIPVAALWQSAPYEPYTQVVRSEPQAPLPQTILDSCETAVSNNQPPCNPFLASSIWAISHSSSYAQGSAFAPGPISDDSFLSKHIDLGGIPVTINFSARYADGGIVAWTTPVGVLGTIVKIDHTSFTIIDNYNPQLREENPPEAGSLSISGAYTLVDSNNHFIVGRSRTLEKYGDSVEGDRFSPIALLGRFDLPAEAFCNDDDFIVGMTMSYDGHLIVISEQGVLTAVSKNFDAETAVSTHSLPLNDCISPEIDIVSNNIAIDENGGIFVATSQEVIRINWSGVALIEAWRARYEAGSGTTSSLRLGPGSGSTPSLMGTDQDDDKFVVITDGQALMHLVLLWRDEIPDDWTPISPNSDRRIACQFPITFGDSETTQTLSEQSVLVNGYATVHVNNQLQQEPRLWQAFPSALRTLVAAGAGGRPNLAPLGIERIDWNPETRQCETVWANSDMSIPNGIPTMSVESNLIYGIGQREGVWGLEAIDFETGASAFFVESRQKRCSLTAVRQIEPRALRFFSAVRLANNPRGCENAFFAATEVGPDGSIYTGTLLGVSKFSTAEKKINSP